eukprot:6178304-Pleurochrysis_carterae.AAC.2
MFSAVWAERARRARHARGRVRTPTLSFSTPGICAKTSALTKAQVFRQWLILSICRTGKAQ